jgi:hypothetical protein
MRVLGVGSAVVFLVRDLRILWLERKVLLLMD